MLPPFLPTPQNWVVVSWFHIYFMFTNIREKFPILTYFSMGLKPPPRRKQGDTDFMKGKEDASFFSPRGDLSGNPVMDILPSMVTPVARDHVCARSGALRTVFRVPFGIEMTTTKLEAKSFFLKFAQLRKPVRRENGMITLTCFLGFGSFCKTYP